MSALVLCLGREVIRIEYFDTEYEARQSGRMWYQGAWMAHCAYQRRVPRYFLPYDDEDWASGCPPELRVTVEQALAGN